MRGARISILGLYTADNTIFDGMAFPSEFVPALVRDRILMECAELEVIYPEPELMKLAITNWSKTELPVWEKLNATLHLEYNPIWNKDGTITETESYSEANRGTGSNNSTDTTTSTEEDSVSAFDQASGYTPRDKTTANGTATGTESNSFNNSGEHDIARTRRETGNIGVTTTQQMIKEEREIALFNIYDYIVDSFKRRFCIMVY